MRLVIKHQIGDDYTWWATSTLPIISDSLEFAIVEFDNLYKATKQKDEDEFRIFGHQFSVYEVDREYPEFLTIDEWFKHIERITK